MSGKQESKRGLLTQFFEMVESLTERRRDFVWILLLTLISATIMISFGFGYMYLGRVISTFPVETSVLGTVYRLNLTAYFLLIPAVTLMFCTILMFPMTVALFMYTAMGLLQRGLED